MYAYFCSYVSLSKFTYFCAHIFTGCIGGQIINVVVDDNVISEGSTSVNDTSDQRIVATDPKSNRAALGAAAAVAVAGVILIGPITGIVVAGAALYATTRDDNIGDAARKGGAAACSAYDFGMQKAREHNVFSRLQDAAAITMKKAKEVNEELKITDTARKLNEEHKITDRVSAAGISAAMKTPGVMSSFLKMASSSSKK
jgi:hypothetical protein